MMTTYELNNFQNFGPPSISAERLNKMDAAIKESIENRVSKALEKEVVLLASRWIETAECYKQDIKIAEVTDTTVQYIYPALNLSAEEIKSLQKADIQDGGQTIGKITLCAYGKKPTIDLKIRVLIQEAIYAPATSYEDVSNVEF